MAMDFESLLAAAELTADNPALLPTSSLPNKSGRRSTAARMRKRERDKEAQRTKRDRERRYIANLEAELSKLRGQLEGSTGRSDALLSPGTQTVPGEADAITINDNSDIDGGARESSLCFAASKASNDASPKTYFHSPPSMPVVLSPVVSTVSSGGSIQGIQSDDIVLSSAALKRLLATPEWLRLPKWNLKPPSNWILRGGDFPELMAQLKADPTLAIACPLEPKALDLLFGGSSNLLANFSYEYSNGLPLLAPEKFASTYFMYSILRWLVWPNEDNFHQFPHPYRPTALQLVQDHHLAFTFVPWPQMRDNFIRYHEQYDDLEHVLGLFCCTVRIGGFFGKTVIIRENDEEPRVREDFKQQFMNPSSWFILERFGLECPQLVEGLDPSVFIQEEDLMSYS